MNQNLTFAIVLTLCITSVPCRAGILRDQIAAIAATVDGRVGVHASLIEAQRSVDLHGDERYPMQSVYKFPIAMYVLRLVDDGVLDLDQQVKVTTGDYVPEHLHSPMRDAHPEGTVASLRELLRLNVSESDGSACDVLLRLSGGPSAAMEYLRTIDVQDVRVIDTEKTLGTDRDTQYRNWATPRGAVRLLRALYEGRGLSTSSRALLLQFMTDTPTGMKRLKGELPPGTAVAHKTGTSLTRNGITAATNDIGIITLPDGRHVAVAVFISDAAGATAHREAAIARISRAIYEAWSN